MTQPTFWQHKNIISCALWPLSLVYSSISALHLKTRAWCAYKAPIPVISVGNINVGGVGKTPVVAFIAESLSAQGHRVAILSRGYGGTHKRPYKVTLDDTATDVGDEPAMLFQQFQHQSVDVWVGANRKASAKRAVAAGATVIILDDGYQYLALKHTLNIAVVDGTHYFGNGFTLPAGPLREGTHALNRAHLILVLNGDKNKTPKYPIKTLHLQTEHHSSDVSALKKISRKSGILAFAGIGNPNKFFNQLKTAGIDITQQKPFKDHHPYDKKTLQNLQETAKTDNLQLVTTEKDAIKLPSAFRRKVATVRLHLTGKQLADLTQTLYNTCKAKI